MNLLLGNKYGVPSQNFVKKNVLCEQGDEITRFDGIDIVSITKKPVAFSANGESQSTLLATN